MDLLVLFGVFNQVLKCLECVKIRVYVFHILFNGSQPLIHETAGCFQLKAKYIAKICCKNIFAKWKTIFLARACTRACA